MIAANQAEGRLRSLQIISGLQRIDVGDDAIDRRAHDGLPQVELGLIDLRFGLQVLWIVFRRRVHVAAELRQHGIGVALRHRQPVLRRAEIVTRLVERRLRGHGARCEFALTLDTELVHDTLNVLLKFEADIEVANKQIATMTYKAKQGAGLPA